jgi:hypothetical protein
MEFLTYRVRALHLQQQDEARYLEPVSDWSRTM